MVAPITTSPRRARCIALAAAAGAVLAACGSAERVATAPSPGARATTTTAAALSPAPPASTVATPATTPTTRPPTTTIAPKLSFDECRPPLPVRTAPAGMVVTLQLDKQVYERKDAVTMTLRVQNTGSETISRTWKRGTTDHDLWLSSGGHVFWRWSHGDLFSGSGPTIYTPGHDETWKEPWVGEVCRGDHKEIPPRAPGRYAARGYVVDEDAAWLSNEVTFEVR